jgi:hypothetical protein
VSFHKLLGVLVAGALAVAPIAAARSSQNETARLTVHSTRSLASATAHNGESVALGPDSLELMLTPGTKAARLVLTSAGGELTNTLTIPSFLRTGGTWILPGSAFGSSATQVAIAIYPEGPGAGKGSGKNTDANYADVDAFVEKTDTTSATVGLSTNPLAVGHTTFAITDFYGTRGCQIFVSGPQIKGKKFNLGNGVADVVASPKANEAFIVTASHYRR